MVLKAVGKHTVSVELSGERGSQRRTCRWHSHSGGVLSVTSGLSIPDERVKARAEGHSDTGRREPRATRPILVNRTQFGSQIELPRQRRKNKSRGATDGWRRPRGWSHSCKGVSWRSSALSQGPGGDASRMERCVRCRWLLNRNRRGGWKGCESQAML